MKAVLFFCIFIFSSISIADDIYIVIMKKQEQKKQRGWSLASWMETKKVIDMQNQWLALNSSANTFEFFLEGRSVKYDFSDTQNAIVNNPQQGLAATLGAYFTIIGVEYEYDKTNEDYLRDSILMSLRIFGTAEQNSSISFGYGFQSYTFNDDKIRNNFWQAKLNLNITSFIGLEALYRSYLEKENSTGISDGNIIKYGAFVDISFIRLFFNKFKERFNHSATNQIRDGYHIGMKLFF